MVLPLQVKLRIRAYSFQFYFGVYAPEVILVMIGSQILIKTLYEIVMYPITRKVLLTVRNHAGVEWVTKSSSQIC